jgi:endonuclease III
MKLAGNSSSLAEVVGLLKRHHGSLPVPPSSDPFELILWENIAYLASPARKREAFEKLRSSIGTSPDRILAAGERDLRAVGAFGILKKATAAKLRTCARIAVELFAGDVKGALGEPIQSAVSRLKVFPSIGTPGAERVLLFAGRIAALSPESNGIRVLGRVGMIPQDTSYGRMYSAARSLSLGTRRKPAWFQEAHILLQEHGRTLCRRKAPQCPECPLRKICNHAQGAGRAT